MDDYKNIEELLEILRARGLATDDSYGALHYLRTVGHFRLDPYYRVFYSTEKEFDRNIPTSLEDVVLLYSFDRRLRLLLMGPLEKIEVALRALIVKEIGDYLQRKGTRPPITINLFDRSLYDLSKEKNRREFEIFKSACERGAHTKWGRDAYFKHGRLPREDLERLFKAEYAEMPAWQVLQTVSFGPLAHIFALLRTEIAVPIARHFKLPREVLTSIFYLLKDVRNACAHHEPVWNWNAERRSSVMAFPRALQENAQITERNKRQLYGVCAVLHILLSFLSQGRSTWYRRLKKLINEYNTIYSSAMGFPADWQTSAFWCVPDVNNLTNHQRLRTRVASP